MPPLRSMSLMAARMKSGQRHLGDDEPLKNIDLETGVESLNPGFDPLDFRCQLAQIALDGVLIF